MVSRKGIDLEANEKSMVKDAKQTPMYKACFRNYEEGIDILLGAGAKIDFFDYQPVELSKRKVVEPFNQTFYEGLS